MFNWMGVLNISNCNMPSALLTYTLYPLSHVKTALQLSQDLEFASPFPLRMYDNLTLPIDVVKGVIPEV